MSYISFLRDYIEKRRELKYVFSSIAGVILVMYLLFIILPLWSRISAISRNISDVKKEIQSTENGIKNMDNMIKSAESLKGKLSSLSGGAFGKGDIEVLLEEFAVIAQKSNVKILSVTPSEFKNRTLGSKEGPYYLEMPVKMTAKSGFHQLGFFLSNLGISNRLIAVTDVRISYNQSTPRLHDVQVMVKTYVPSN